MNEPEASSAVPKRKLRWYQFSLRTLLALPLCLAVSFAILHYVLGRFETYPHYSMVCTFARLPDDDQRLKEWLTTQEGVYVHFVRVSRQGTKVKVAFLMARRCNGTTPFPDLESACASLGYEGPASKWVDEADSP
jgi:hypothetical protein